MYAGGRAVGQDKHLYYLGDPKCETKDALIKTIITDIFESGYGNYTFYAHNFARFDGHLLLILYYSIYLIMTHLR